MINLTFAAGYMGYFGVQDCLNNQYTATARESMYASPEQNRKLEERLMMIYKDYLEEVANSNNGRY